MAEWKKVVVSGSVISQLQNDAGYLTSATVGSFVSGSDAAARTKLNSLTSTVLGYVESIDQNLGTANNVTFTDLALDGDLAINTNKFTVDSATGNTVVAGTLNVTGGITGSLKGNVDGNAGTATKLATARSITTTGDVVLASANFDGSANFTTTATIQAGAVDASMFSATAASAITGSATALSSSLAGRINTLEITGPTNAATASHIDAESAGQGLVTVGDTSNIDLGLTTSASPTFASLTLTGDLTVNGSTTSLNTTNVNVEDKFILVNSGSAAADGGIVVNGAGTSFGWDNSAGRWAFDAAGATWNQTTITSDAYAAAVVTTDDAKYRYNGNIRVTSGDIFI